MKRVRLTLRTEDVDVHPVYDLVTGGADYVTAAELLTWNVDGPTPGFLHRVEGDADAFAADLDAAPEVVDHEIIRIDPESFYSYHRCEVTPASMELLETFTRGSLLVVYPVEFNQDGSATMTVVGRSREIEDALAGVPPSVGVDVEAVGSPSIGDEEVRGRLSERQREAVATGIEVGYYDVPRQATHEDVARAMDCAPSTAALHLQKAEAKALTGLFE